MPVLTKIIVLLFGLAAMILGVRTILRQEARFSLSEDNGEQRVVEGFPAIVVGLGEVLTGVSLLLYQHLPL